tara:strand:- start:1170 stop:1367 length:198 start_codon:yes stop_codon:yes gene_type:complete
MKDLIMIGGGIAIGWYLALNKKKEVENALRIAKKEINNLSSELQSEIKEGDRLAGRIVSEDVNRR